MFSRLMFVVGLLALLASVDCYNPGTSWRIQIAFAALKQGGSVVVWGDTSYGTGTSYGTHDGVPSGGISNVQAIYSTYAAFAALKSEFASSQRMHTLRRRLLEIAFVLLPFVRIN